MENLCCESNCKGGGAHEQACWRHVRSEQNPADLISRGVRPQDLTTDELWWHDPPWLASNTKEWCNPIPGDYDTKEEEKCHLIFLAYFREFDDLLDRISSYSKGN